MSNAGTGAGGGGVIGRATAIVVAMAGLVGALAGLDEALARWQGHPSFFGQLLKTSRAEATTIAPGEHAITGPIRIFVHIDSTDADQLSKAERLQIAIQRDVEAATKVTTPPVRIVTHTPSDVELRCLKIADCAHVQLLAREVGVALQRPVNAVDKSGDFDSDPNVRLGTFELWLPAGSLAG
jgi:hypothetical protein